MATRESSATERGWTVPAAVALIVLAALVAYHNSFRVPFLLDDGSSILRNPTIRSLGPGALSPPPGGLTVSGRPFLNLTLAVNFAVGGTDVEGYHVVNLAIHVLAALVLFGIVRRTCTLPDAPRGRAAAAEKLALAVSLLWVVHPLQTASVTYVVQRSEALAGLLYLLTLYSMIRGATGERTAGWFAAAVGACLLGMATKEMMVTAPVVVLLYDRTFLSGSFRSALRRRSWLYAGLSATWCLLAWLVASSVGRGATAGFDTGVSPWAYAVTQLVAVARYLRLSLWPDALTFDYGGTLARTAAEIIPAAVVVAAVLAAIVLTIGRRPTIGFLGVAFLVLLAPSSSVVPVATQAIAEHRMYLPLAALAALVVAVGHELFKGQRTPATIAVVMLTVALGLRTVARNEDYASGLSIWRDTVAKRPENVRALNNLSAALMREGLHGEAKGHLEAALRLAPGSAEAHANLGEVMTSLGYPDRAMAHCREALQLGAGRPEVHYGVGNAMSLQGRFEEAVGQYERAISINRTFPDAHANLGSAKQGMGRFAEAATHYREALRLAPGHREAANGLAWLLATCPVASLRNGREAVELAIRAAGRGGRASPEVLDTLAAAYAEAGRFPAAVRTQERAVAGATDARKGEFGSRLELYRSGRPYRQSAPLR
ncbi:MAG: tetratricopeptide repeat protein [Planctomycetota bacterium]|jgi:tetratricopeptide (TPR) repeat protein